MLWNWNFIGFLNIWTYVTIAMLNECNNDECEIKKRMNVSYKWKMSELEYKWYHWIWYKLQIIKMIKIAPLLKNCFYINWNVLLDCIMLFYVKHVMPFLRLGSICELIDNCSDMLASSHVCGSVYHSCHNC